jgi:voltage-gated potassium channel
MIRAHARTHQPAPSAPPMIHPKLHPLKHLFEKHDTGWGRVFDFFILFLIGVSVVCFSIDTLPNQSPETERLLDILELSIVSIFTIEYLIRILVADHKLKFMFSFLGLIDLVAILPFYLAVGVDLRMLRAFRFLRVFGALKVVRYNKAVWRMKHAFHVAKEEIVLFMVTALMLIYFAAVGIYYFENPVQPNVFSSVFDSLWWSVITLTTVGYGDMRPVTLGGRVFTFLVLLIGLGIFSVPAGLVASAMITARDAESEREASSVTHIHPTGEISHER